MTQGGFCFVFLAIFFYISHYILKCYLNQLLLYHTSKFVVTKGPTENIFKSKEVTKIEKQKKQNGLDIHVTPSTTPLDT